MPNAEHPITDSLGKPDKANRFHSARSEASATALSKFMTFDTLLFAACADLGIYISTDKGGTWHASSSGLKSGYVNSFAAIGAAIYACAGGVYNSFARIGETQPGGVFRSLDSGKTWVETDSGMSKSAVYAVAAHDTDILAGTQDGIYRTLNNGKTWTGMFSGIPRTSFDVLAANTTDFLAGSTRSGVWRSVDSGAAWSELTAGLPAGASLSSLCASGTRFLAGAQDSGMYLWNENSAAWAPANAGFPAGAAIVSLTPGTARVFAGTRSHGIYSSSDNGLHWAASNKGIPDTASISSITVFGSRIYAGSRQGRIYRSVDDGGTWTEMPFGRITGNSISSIAAGDSLIVAGAVGDSCGAYRSVNDGRSFSAVIPGLPREYMTAGYTYFAQALQACGTNVFAGTENGAYLLSENGTSWTDISDGLPGSCSIGSLMIRGNTIYAGTASDGMWRRPLSEMVNVGKQTVFAPRNYPRVKVIQHRGMISFSLDAARAPDASLELLTVSGKRAAFVRGRVGKEIEFPNQLLPAEAYEYKLTTGAITLRGRITVVK
jgi:hypothetical protein